ncbi:hypothetical protein KFK09_023604 [Dendrobium nobile]|uniref:Myb/SANT-like domain-containing protein n=1 Tax=Dendrobium nobile TaxID=94219 RepID=A0A8T3AA73_DENNO|nr:hypothetical protein KFK09_023604 [Dendrobium nobile]
MQRGGFEVTYNRRGIRRKDLVEANRREGHTMGKSKDGGASATCERDVKLIFCDLCLKEIELGNRPTTHFNRDGCMNLMKFFQEKTSREYVKIELKNKWDQLKK